MKIFNTPSNVDMTMVHMVADAFAAEMRDALNPSQWAEMRRLNATPDYQGGCCASHNYCDANVVMDAAMRSTLGWEPLSEEGEDELIMSDLAIDIWNAAWDIAHRTTLRC